MGKPTAFVTGGGSGIGLATAWHLSRAGYALALFDVNGDALDRVAEEIGSTGSDVLAISGDVACEADMDRAMDAIINRFGGLDAVVANAGINGVWAPVETLTADEWDNTVRINLRGTFVTLNRTVPLLKTRGGGAIVIVSSINGVRTFTNPGATAYSATKSAQVAMTYQLALELGSHNIRINVVCPGAIDTNIGAATEIRNRAETEIPVIWPEGSIPINNGKPGAADDVAEAIGFLLGDSARHITGTPLFLDGGQGILR